MEHTLTESEGIPMTDQQAQELKQRMIESCAFWNNRAKEKEVNTPYGIETEGIPMTDKQAEAIKKKILKQVKHFNKIAHEREIMQREFALKKVKYEAEELNTFIHFGPLIEAHKMVKNLEKFSNKLLTELFQDEDEKDIYAIIASNIVNNRILAKSKKRKSCIRKILADK